MGATVRRLLRLLVRALGWAAFALVALGASVVLHLQLPITRRVAGSVIGQFVTDEVRGQLLIGRFDRLSLQEVVAHDVTLFDGEGRRVVEAKHLRMVPDLAALSVGRLRFSSARLEHGEVWLYDAGDGLPSLFTSFDSQVAGPPSADPLRVIVDGIQLLQVELRGELLGLQGLRAEVDDARGQLDIHTDVHVRLDSARGRLLEPYGFVAVVDSLSGTISTVPDEGVDLRARARRGQELTTARIRFAAPKGRPDAEEIFTLELQAQQLSTDTVRAVGLDFMPELAARLSGELVLQGPFSALALDGRVTSEAGDALVRGLISDVDGATVTVTSERMQVSRLWVAAPELTLSGELRIEAPPDESDTKLTLVVDPVIYDTWAIPAIELHGALTDDGVRIESAAARSRGARIDVRGEVAFSGALDLRVSASFADIGADANLKRVMPDARGALTADVTFASPDLSRRLLRFAGKVAVRDLRYGPLRAGRLQVAGSGSGDAQRPALRLTLRGEQVQVGDYPLGDPSLTVRGGPREYQADGQFVSAGRRTFNASARIVAEPERFIVDADPIEFAVGDGSWRGAMQQLVFVPGSSVQVQLLRLASRSQRLEAHGIVRMQGPDAIEAQLQDFDLAAINALLGGQFFLQQGRADAQLTLSGDIGQRPELQLQGALRDGALADLQGVNALFLIHYAGGRLEADGEVDLGDRGALTLNGTGSLDPRRVQEPLEALRRGSYDLELSSQGLSLALLKAAREAGIQCKLSGHLRVRGTLEQPEFNGKVSADPLHLPGWDELRITAEGGYGAGQLAARVTVADPRGPIGTADGRLDLDWKALLAEPDLLGQALLRGPWQLTGTTAERRLDQLPAPLSQLAPYPVALELEFDLRKQAGATSGELRYRGAVADLARDSICGKSVQLRMHGALELAKDTSHITLTALNGAKAVASAEATVDTPFDRWIEELRVERPRLFRSSARIEIDSMQRLPYLCEYGNGSLRAELELDGGLSAEPILVAVADTTLYPRVMQRDRRHPVRVRSCEKDPIRAHFELNADRDQLTLRGNASGCHGGATELQARLPVTWQPLLVLPTADPTRELSGRVRFDGAQLKPLLDRIPGLKNSDVLARGQVELAGKPSALRMSGGLSLAEGKLYLVPTGQDLTGIEGKLDFRGSWAKLEGLRAQAGKGEIEVSGGIGWRGIWPERFRLALRAKELPVKREGVDLGWVSTHAAIDAEVKADRAQAVIKLNDLTLRLPDAVNRSLQGLAPHPEVTVVTEVPEAKPAVYPIELVIDGQQRVTIRRNDFEASVKTELALAYRDPDLHVGGYIEFVGGNFEVFGKRFDINSGALRFDGGTDLNPDVYLSATQKPEAAGLSPVSVSATGTLAEPEVTFSSDVCPGDNGAITYLVSGRCTADDLDVAQESENARDAVATGLLSGVLTLGAQSQLAELRPRAGVQSVGQGGVRVSAGISSESVVPQFMRGLVRRVYIQGGVTSGENDPAVADQAVSKNPLDFMIELYFPHSVVTSGRFAQETWGLDITWEP